MFLTLMQIAVKKQAVILTLPNICSLTALALLTAALVWFLELTKEKGMILRRPYAVLTFWLWYKTRPRYYRYAVKYKTVAELIAAKWKPKTAAVTVPRRTVYTWLYKVLGGCVWCSGTWIATAFYLLVAPDFGLTWLQVAKLWPLFIGANYAFMELINKIR